jgi:hypothetical protein
MRKLTLYPTESLTMDHSADIFNLADVENDIATELRRAPPLRASSVVDYAPPAVRSPLVPMPSYVEHADGVSDVGRLSAEAMVRDFEAAAKEVEAMFVELTDAAKRCETMVAAVLKTGAEIKETAAHFRDEGKRAFEEIQRCSLMNEQVRETCNTLKANIAGSKET